MSEARAFESTATDAALGSRLERRLAELARDAGELSKPLADVLSNPGKRVRARMVLAWTGAGAVPPDPDDALDAAAAVELLHEASLLHDDICDRGLTRRGRPSIAAAYDVRTATLAGAFFVGRALSTLGALFRRAGLAPDVGFLSALSLGQLLEAFTRTSESADRTAYLDVAKHKTGALFAFASELGARLGRAELELARGFAHPFGLAFQMLDDVLDLEAAESLRKASRDLEAGVMSWPLLDWMEASADPAQARARLALAPPEALEALRQEILDSGAARRGRERVAFELARAGACVDRLPESEGKAQLRALVREVARR